MCFDETRIVWVIIQARDFANFDPVELHLTASVKACNGSFEPDNNFFHRAHIVIARNPIDKAEANRSEEQREQADCNKIGFGFHLSVPVPLADGAFASEVFFDPWMIVLAHFLDRSRNENFALGEHRDAITGSI